MASFFKESRSEEKTCQRHNVGGLTQKCLRLSSLDDDVDGTMTEEDNISPSYPIQTGSLH